jgi:ubiquinone/menaquinone biosynthesis C-methylase UbiE
MDKPDYKESVRDYYVQNLAKMDVADSFSEIKTDMLKKHCAPGDRVLAAGCGTGNIELAIADLVGGIWGCDFTFDALRLFDERLDASDLNNIRVVNGDLTDFTF